MQPTTSEIHARLQAVFRTDAAVGMECVYQFEIAHEPRLHLVVSNGTLWLEEGRHRRPSVTMIFPDLETALLLLEGDLDPMEAFLDGRIRSDGNLLLALRLIGLFRG